MTASEITPHRAASGVRRVARSRSVRFIAGAAVVGIASTAIVTAGGGAAGAATEPNAQSVGRFLDGTVGGNAIQQLADLKDARATAPGSQSVQNPLDLKLLNALDVPLTGALQLPGGGVVGLGAANQVAVAKTDGYSYGGAGAVANSGGVSVGGDNSAFPADAKIDLSSAALGSVGVPGLPTSIPGLPPIPGLPTGGTTDLAALGGITADIGAVHALAQTKSGGAVVTPNSGVATVKLSIGSPALGGLLAQLSSLLDPSVLNGILGTAGTLTGGKCALTAKVKPSISLDGGAVVIDVAKATITIDLGKLIDKLLGKDISNLSTSNFDLISFLVKNLPDILSQGLEDVITGITDPLKDQFTKCLGLLGPLGEPAKGAIDLLTSGQGTLIGAINGVAGQLSASSKGPLGQLADGLKNVVDIGLNVQSGPGIEKHDTAYPFESDLAATPDQATDPVKNQTLVRAIEIDLLDVSGLPTGGGTLPGLPPLPGLPGTNAVHVHQLGANDAHAFAPHALAPGGGAAVLALANAAVGPSNAAAPPTSSSAPPSTSVPATSVPTGVPAGAAGHHNGGSPVLPLVLLLLGLTVAGGGVLSLRMRGKFGFGK